MTIKKNIIKFNIGNESAIGIYGTGAGALEVFDVLKKLKLDVNIKCFIDRDDAEKQGGFLLEKPVCRLFEVLENLSFIIIAAQINHMMILERLQSIQKIVNGDVKIINPYIHQNSDTDKLEYIKYIEDRNMKAKDDFVPIDSDEFERNEHDTKILAWYLPQYYEIEINNIFHGQGFTEWTNTSKAYPQFCGHYQPHIPYDVGYYNLLNIDTFKRQAFLAKKYGVYGWCFHYYWFSGKRLMEKPIELFLKNKEINMPFCINWADESWTSVWDDEGQYGKLMYEQRIDVFEAELFMKDLLPLIRDPRYIKVDGKPMISIYRCDHFDKDVFSEFIIRIREIAKREGFPDLFILLTTASKNDNNPQKYGLDGLVEFPPHRIVDLAEVYVPDGYLNPNFKGTIYDMKEFIENEKYLVQYETDKVFRTALTSYDNTARKCESGAGVLVGLNPDTYKKWLKDLLEESKRIHSSEENFVFVNAWNEWAEGAHLEPDLKYGYAYLKATKEALIEARECCQDMKYQI